VLTRLREKQAMPDKPDSNLFVRENVGDVIVVRITVPTLGNDDTTNDLFRQIYSLVDHVEQPRLVLDLGAVEYLASMALGKLIMLLRKTREAHGRVALYHLTPSVDRLLQITHLADILPIYEDEREALQSFAR
jgi:anti-anti-sigma factor